jgi:hypothetical protein
VVMIVMVVVMIVGVVGVSHGNLRCKTSMHCATVRESG